MSKVSTLRHLSFLWHLDFDIWISFQTMKFIVDRMLGKLAKQLRMLGYDTLYYRGEDVYPLIRLARQEGRVILTRNTKLIPRRPEDVILRITEDDPLLQLKELIQKGNVEMDEGKVFSRCLLCNALLDPISRNKVEGKVPDFIFHQHKEFFRCPQCQRIYWPGSHQENMQKRIKELSQVEHNVKCQMSKSK